MILNMQTALHHSMRLQMKTVYTNYMYPASKTYDITAYENNARKTVYNTTVGATEQFLQTSY